MFKDVDIVIIFLRNRNFVQQIFLRNRRFRLRQKYPLANFRVELFSCLRVSIPGGYPRRSILLFQTSRHGQFLL